MIEPKKFHLHFVGIGGIGMSGIAEVLHNQGYRVSGSDLSESANVERLRAAGIKVYIGHQSSHVAGAHVVVTSSAVSAENPEVAEARSLKIPVIPRAEMLGELMRGKTGIAVAGSHGKTTCTSMLATIFSIGGYDPTIVIGGIVNSLGGNAKLGSGEYVIAEADESDGSFQYLPATFSVLTNVDNDHLDFFKTTESIDEAFSRFINKLPFYGVAAVCGDDPGVRRILSNFKKPFVTYGFSESSDYFASDVESGGMESSFELHRKGTSGPESLGQVRLRVPGEHNILNALGAISLSDRVGISPDKYISALAEYKGVGRRFEICFEDKKGRRAIVDDYGHHPTEILATLKAARGFWPGRIVTLFQPHRFSRTQHCFQEFQTCFEQSDVVHLTDIYPAGETPIQGISSEKLVESLKKTARSGQEFSYVGDLDSAKGRTLQSFQEGDLLICLGAGSITHLARRLVADLQR